MGVIVSKLQIPRRPSIVRRTRLTLQVREIISKKLLTVIGGAGFGKTSLIVDAIGASAFLPVWYRLDEQDMDFYVFVSYLYAAVEKHAHPGSTIKESNFPAPGLKKHADILLAWLRFAQNRLEKESVIILDDYHLVQDNPEINGAVEFILDRLPEHLHMIIIGRKRLPLALARLRVSDQMIEINQDALLFTEHEIQLFFAHRDDISAKEFDDIAQLTKGWAASLILLRYAFGKLKQVSLCLNEIKKKPDYIFSYLRETIFDIQPEYVRHFMMKAALLPEIDAEMCPAFFEIDDAHMILNKMIEDHLLIFPVDDSGKIFYLHHLFRDFLLEQLHKTYSEAQLCRIHNRIADQIKGLDVCRAIHHYIQGKDYDNAIQVIKTHEMNFLIEGKTFFLGSQIKKIPGRFFEKYPRLLLVLARLYSHDGCPEKAIDLIFDALQLYKRQGAGEEMITCVVELGSQYYFSGHLKEAKLLMEQVLGDIDPRSQTYMIAMTYLPFLASILGEFELARTYDRNARDIIAEYPEFERQIATALVDTSLTHTLYFAGEFEQSQRLCRKLLKRVMALNIERCLPLVYYQLSANSFYLGAYEDGCEYARKGIKSCENISLVDSTKAWVYLAWGQNCLGLGAYDAAIEKIECCTALFEGPKNRWGMANTYDLQAAVYLAQKKTGPAGKRIDHALDIIKGYGLTVTRGILENSRSKLLLAENQHRAALERLLKTRQNLKGASYHLFNNLMLTAHAYFKLGNSNLAADSLNQAYPLCANHSFDRFVIREKNWLLPLLKRYSGGGRLDPSARRHLEDIFRHDLEAMPPTLAISLLGRFRLYRGDIPISSWKSTKALMILKYLAAVHHRGYIHKERLIEMLWPDQDPQKTAGRFNMAMSTLRKTLEPDILPKAASAYIDRKKEMYRLYDDDRIVIDTDRFSDHYSRAVKERSDGEAALPHYLKAIELYEGEFLEEDRFEEWCMEYKERFYMDYMNALQNTILIFKDKKDLENAIRYAMKLLSVNPLDEVIVGQLMGLYADKGMISKAKAVFEGYVGAAEHAEIPPSKKLIDLHHDLVKI